MDAEIEVVDGVVEADIVPRPEGALRRRVRTLAANPGLQAGAAATAGMLVGAATMTLLRRAGAPTRVSDRPVGPSQARWPGPTIGPIAPGTYIVRVRAIGLPPQA